MTLLTLGAMLCSKDTAHEQQCHSKKHHYQLQVPDDFPRLSRNTLSCLCAHQSSTNGLLKPRSVCKHERKYRCDIYI